MAAEGITSRIVPEKRLMQVNVCPRLVPSFEGAADAFLAALQRAVDFAADMKAAGTIDRVVVLLDGRAVKSGGIRHPDVSSRILQVLSENRDKEDLIAQVLIANPDADVKMAYALSRAVPALRTIRSKIKFIE